MTTVALSGNDTISINNRILNDLAADNVVELTFENAIAVVKTGKNGNTIYSLNTTGQQAQVKLKVIRGSSDDKYLNGLLTQQNLNFAGFPLMIAEFTKKIGNGKGTIGSDIYVLSGGVFTKQVDAKSSVEGDIEQSEAMYTMMFSLSPRALT